MPTQSEAPAPGGGGHGGGFAVEEIVQHPLPGYAAPSAIAFSPDDRLVSYLYSPEGTLNRKLFAWDPATRQEELLVTPAFGGVDEDNISTAEKLRRERLRERHLGVTRYEWSKSGQGQPPMLLVPLPNGVFVQAGPAAPLRLAIASSPSLPVLDPQISPDGTFVAFVQNDELFTVPTEGGRTCQLMRGARGSTKVSHGLAEYIAQEEMERRSGFWISLDSKLVAFTEADASAVPPFRIIHQGKPAIGAAAEEDHAYPFAGQANVRVRLGVVPSGGGDITWMDVHCGLGGEQNEEEEYLARVAWLPDGGLVAQIQNRQQTRLKLCRFDPATGRREVLLVEESDVWVNLNECFTPLHKGAGRLAGAFVWASERTGFRHLYLHDARGECLGALTGGDWMVEQVAGLDESRGLIYFTGTADGPLECHLYAARLEVGGGAQVAAPRRLTRGRGKHAVVLDHQVARFVDAHDSLHAPLAISLCSLEDGRVLAPIHEQPQPLPRVEKLRLTPPELLQVESKHGAVLHGALYRPDAAVFGPGPYRTVVSVYGGPHVQTVMNSWMTTVDMRAQYLRSKGFLVWKLDNRGSARRGLKFEGAIRHCMGKADVEDQEMGVQWLISRQLADPARIGIYGWSYGGYMAAMALARCPHLFRCAVSGAPVTSWDGYDTHYTERYMGLPAVNVAGYEWSSVMHHVPEMRGKLMLVHGMIDENVHFRHTARLINALTAAAKEYELLVFPDERHMPRGLKDRMYMEERIFEFLDRNLR